MALVYYGRDLKGNWSYQIISFVTDDKGEILKERMPNGEMGAKIAQTTWMTEQAGANVASKIMELQKLKKKVK